MSVTYPASSMNPEKDEHDPGGHAMEVVDTFGVDASCHYKSSVKI